MVTQRYCFTTRVNVCWESNKLDVNVKRLHLNVVFDENYKASLVSDLGKGLAGVVSVSEIGLTHQKVLDLIVNPEKST